MKRTYIPVLIFAVLFLFTMPFGFDLATSVIPGWHVTIFPPYFVSAISAQIALGVVTLAYYMLAFKNYKTNWIIYTVHALLTIPALLLFKLPHLFIYAGKDIHEMERQLSVAATQMMIANVMFMLGQLLFVIYFTKVLVFDLRRK